MLAQHEQCRIDRLMPILWRHLHLPAISIPLQLHPGSNPTQFVVKNLGSCQTVT